MAKRSTVSCGVVFGMLGPVVALGLVACGPPDTVGDNNNNRNWNESSNNNNGGSNSNYNYNYNYNGNTNGTGGCENLDCGDHGTCVEPGGVARCQCDVGYTGTFCNQCAVGFHLEGTECVADVDVFFGTPTLDGNVTEGSSDWSPDQHVGSDSTPTDWGGNTLTDLYVAYDNNNLYIGVVGYVESTNALAVYIDTDYGPTSGGLASIAGATDNDGALDNALSAAITVSDPSYVVDWAVGTKGMASVSAGMDDNAGWRNIGLDGTNFPWASGDVVSGANGFEAAIPLTSIFGGPVTPGTTIALFARLVNDDGQFLANQTVPTDNPSDPGAVSQVITVTFGGSPGTCNNDGTCDPGETWASCPSDCPQPSLCGDPAVFQWEDAVMYFAMVDRFNDSDGANVAIGVDWEADYQGGDWQGLEQKIPYLSNLGVNTIWLSAPYENRNLPGAAIDPGSDPHMYSAYHGYWPSPADIDYTNPNAPVPTPAVESKLGTSQDLHNLIGTAHANGMYVLFDYVMNHVDGASGLYGAHNGWFATDTGGNTVLCPPNNWDDPYWGTRCAFTDYLPPFDFYQSAVRDWSVADAIWWAKEYNIDGYRLDAIKHVPFDWLTDLRAALNAEFTPPPNGDRFYLVGETYDYGNQGVLAAYINPQTMLDGQFDFPLRLHLCQAFLTGSEDLNSLFSFMDGNDAFYPAGALMSTWIGNHDIPRAIHFANGGFGGNCYEGSNVGNGWNPGSYTQPTNAEPYEKLGLAFGVLLTNRGVPLIYYGDEIGLAGGGDPDNRRMMQFTGLNSHQQDLLDLVSRLVQIRNDHVSLRRGYRQTLTGGTNTFAYKMTGCGTEHDVYVLINRSGSTASIAGVPAGNYTEHVTQTQATGGSLSVPARSIRILTENQP